MPKKRTKRYNKDINYAENKYKVEFVCWLREFKAAYM